MHSSDFFRIKLIARLILKREISGSHTISDQSLLLSTNVLNDNCYVPYSPIPGEQKAAQARKPYKPIVFIGKVVGNDCGFSFTVNFQCITFIVKDTHFN